ncbi:MAG: hypothetical protein QE263_01575 [Vampirovibrionales bacterium]|nr:hypothetical protein [Vampirovibrionales bacterium]
MTALSPIQSNVTQFGCHQSQPANVKAQFGHVCNGLGCCVKFSAQARTNSCDSTGCSTGPTVLGVLGAIGLGFAALFVGKRVIGTVFGTASTSIRDFCSRLFTGKGLVEKAKALSKNALDTAKANGYVQGASDGLVTGWNKALVYVRRLIG